MADTSFILYGRDILIGAVIGITIGMTGIGGGALIQPTLVYLVGLSPILAVGTGLVYSTITRFGGVITHYRQGAIRLRRTMLFLCGSIPGVLAAAQLVNTCGTRLNPATVDFYLQITIGLVLVATSLLIVIQSRLIKDHDAHQAQIAASRTQSIKRSTILHAVVSGFIVGLLIGATSVGGGVLIIPVFLLFLDADTRQAVGSSNAISLVLSACGGIIYFLGGNTDLRIVGWLCVGSLPGVWLGSRLAVKVPERWLKIIVVTIVLGSGLSLLAGLF